MAAMEKISEQRSFGGVQGFYRHQSMACNGPMRFSVYIPAQATSGKVPVVYYLSGLTCTEENFTIKGGARAAVSIVLERIDLAARNPEGQHLLSTEPPARRWRLWTGTTLAVAGAGALTWGIAWLALDGRGDCGGGQPARCATTYDTRTPGVLLAVGGGALALAGGALLYSGLRAAPLNVTLGMTTRSLQFEARF